MPLPDSPPSLWLAEYGPYLPSPALAGDLGVDVAIVGGGFQGSPPRSRSARRRRACAWPCWSTRWSATARAGVTARLP